MTSDDRKVTLDVPDSFEGDASELSITADPDADIVEGAISPVYDLQPSGTEFPEPAALTIRLAATEGTPVTAVVVRSDDGTARVLETTTRKDGDELTITAPLSTFSSGVPELRLEGGQRRKVHVSGSASSTLRLHRSQRVQRGGPIGPWSLAAADDVIDD